MRHRQPQRDGLGEHRRHGQGLAHPARLDPALAVQPKLRIGLAGQVDRQLTQHVAEDGAVARSGGRHQPGRDVLRGDAVDGELQGTQHPNVGVQHALGAHGRAVDPDLSGSIAEDLGGCGKR